VNEFERIERFTRFFEAAPAPAGPGDDCAVLPPQRRQSCVTTDTVVDGVHFSTQTSSMADIGHKALAVNLSDLAAMGAVPDWALCSLQLPPLTSVRDIEAIAKGMAPLARAHGLKLIGGNVSRSPVLAISMTVSGIFKGSNAAVLRSGAQPGDVVYVSGALGAASCGLALLKNPRETFGLSRTLRARAVAAQRRPAPHVALGRQVAPFANAGIDVSDGLLADLGHIAKASKVAVHLERERIPVFAQAETPFRETLLELAMSGGEDYVLAFTVSASCNKVFAAALRRARFDVFEVGRVGQGSGVWVDGVKMKGSAGHVHF
jgi:thiamine-monophosphate kinase